MYIAKLIKIAGLCTALTLSGCGGSGGTTTPAANVGGSAPTPASRVSLTGVVVDGYLDGAIVFLDLNGNGSLDAGEPVATTTANGRYQLSVTQAQVNSGASVVVDVPATAVDADTRKAVGTRFVMSAPPSKHSVISPMTTLIKKQMDKDASLTVADAEKNIKLKIGLSGSSIDLLADYVAAKNGGAANAAEYERVHMIARVSAEAVKNNLVAMESAAKATGSNASLDDVVGLIVDKVLADLGNIALQVDLVPASKLDPAVVLKKTKVNKISIATVAADVAANQKAAQTPVITLNGMKQQTITQNTVFTDPKAVAKSNIDGDISSSIVVSGSVNTNKLGTYTLAYDVSDSANNKAVQVLRIVRVVKVADTVAPVITMKGAANVTWSSGTLYVDAGVSLDDPYATWTTTGYVDAAKRGKYPLTYNAIDGAGNKATPVTRTVTVVDGTPPAVFLLLGSKNISIAKGSTFIDPYVFAWDATDGDISAKVVITGGPVKTNLVGKYTLTYNVTDAAGNPATPALIRTVNVALDIIKPVVIAPAALTVEATGSLTAVTLGVASATDNLDGGLTPTSSLAGPLSIGLHTITWSATDSSGNVGTATQVVTVRDTTAPTIIAPANIMVTAVAPRTTVNLGLPTGVSDLTSIPTVLNNAPIAGFPVGVTAVTWTAIDAYSNATTVVQTVTVTDVIAPVVTAPANVTLFDTNAAGITAFLNGAIATDNIDGTLTVTNNAPAPLPIGTTVVIFSATDTAGNIGTATALITITVAPVAGAATNVLVNVQTDGVDQNTGQLIGTPGPIASAVVVVDGVEFITDVNGNTSVPGLDVGVHDVHVFANNYTWSSIYGYTSDPAGSTFIVSPRVLNNPGQTPPVGGVGGQYYDSYVLLGVNLPAGYVAPAYSKLEMTLTDLYANTAFTQPHIYTYDPYTGAPLYKAEFSTFFTPVATTFAGTLSTSEVSCDMYGFNCSKTNFADVVQNFTTEPSGIVYSGLPPTVNVAITNAALPITTPVANTTDSQVVMDVNFSNTALTPGTLDVYAQTVGAHVVFSVTDVYGNVSDYSGQITTRYNSGTPLFDPYGNYIGQSPTTVASSQVTLSLYGVASGSALTGNLYVVETTNNNQISNYLDLGVTTITTTAVPYVYTGISFGASRVINAVFSAIPVLPPVANTVVNSSQVDLTALVTNSLYHDPYSARPVGPADTWVDMILHTINAQGNIRDYNGQLRSFVTYDAYGTPVTTGGLNGTLFVWDLPAGSTISGNLTATEVVYDYITNTQSTVQFVDMGLQTFTTGLGTQGIQWKVGLYMPPTTAPAAPRALNIVFPVVPPTPTTTLVLQSVTPPTGMVVDNLNVNDSYTYYDYAGNWNGALTFPYTFTSFGAPQGALSVNVHAYDAITGYDWGKTINQVAIGSNLSITAALNTMGTVAANQTGNVINYNFGGAASPATVIRFNIGNFWGVFVDAKTTSLTLPPVPASITNTFVLGQQYQLGYEVNLLGNYTFNGFFKAYTSNLAGPTIFNTMDSEYLGNYAGVPYTY